MQFGKRSVVLPQANPTSKLLSTIKSVPIQPIVSLNKLKMLATFLLALSRRPCLACIYLYPPDHTHKKAQSSSTKRIGMHSVLHTASAESDTRQEQRNGHSRGRAMICTQCKIGLIGRAVNGEAASGGRRFP